MDHFEAMQLLPRIVATGNSPRSRVNLVSGNRQSANRLLGWGPIYLRNSCAGPSKP